MNMNMDKNKIVVKSVQELEELLKNHKLSFLPREGRIILNIDHMPQDEKQKWEQKLTNDYFNCGCKTGAVGALLLLFAYLFFIILNEGISNILNWQILLKLIAALIIGGILGKAAGLLFSKLKFKINITKLLKLETMSQQTN